MEPHNLFVPPAIRAHSFGFISNSHPITSLNRTVPYYTSTSYCVPFQHKITDCDHLHSLRRRHLRKTYDLLLLFLSRRDVFRAARALTVLFHAHEWKTEQLQHFALLLLPCSNQSDFLTSLMARQSSNGRAKILIDLIPSLISENRFQDAFEQLDMVIHLLPYRNHPILHMYLGIVSLFLSIQAGTLDENRQVVIRHFQNAIDCQVRWIKQQTVRNFRQNTWWNTIRKKEAVDLEASRWRGIARHSLDPQPAVSSKDENQDEQEREDDSEQQEEKGEENEEEDGEEDGEEEDVEVEEENDEEKEEEKEDQEAQDWKPSRPWECFISEMFLEYLSPSSSSTNQGYRTDPVLSNKKKSSTVKTKKSTTTDNRSKDSNDDYDVSPSNRNQSTPISISPRPQTDTVPVIVKKRKPTSNNGSSRKKIKSDRL